MAERGHTQRTSPVTQPVRGWHEVMHARVHVALLGNDVENACGHLHNAERMLEATVRRPRVDEVGESKLMNVSQPLKRRGVDDPSFVRTQTNEDVDWITYLMKMLCHIPFPSITSSVLGDTSLTGSPALKIIRSGATHLPRLITCRQQHHRRLYRTYFLLYHIEHARRRPTHGALPPEVEAS